MEKSSSSEEQNGKPFDIHDLNSSEQYSSIKSNSQTDSWKQESQVVMLPERSKKKIQQAMKKVELPKEIDCSDPSNEKRQVTKEIVDTDE